jgi:hypothetical protein
LVAIADGAGDGHHGREQPWGSEVSGKAAAAVRVATQMSVGHAILDPRSTRDETNKKRSGAVVRGRHGVVPRACPGTARSLTLRFFWCS